MMAALLGSMLAERLGVGAVDVSSSGFGPIDLAPIDEAVEAMRRRGLDVTAHRSTATIPALVDAADLILTAEREHVVKIATLSPDAFRRTMTLPEFLAAAADVPDPDDELIPEHSADRVRRRAAQLTASRGAGEYLRRLVPEVADPTGARPRSFEAAVVMIEQQCRETAEHVVGWIDHSGRRSSTG